MAAGTPPRAHRLLSLNRRPSAAQPTTQCNTRFPSYAVPRIVAGGPLTLSIIKCQLKSIAPADYKVSFTSDEAARLARIFPDGVCDWSKPGVNQVDNETWPSFGPSADNLVYDITRP